MASVRASFGYDSTPILDEVRLDLAHQFEEFYRETHSGEDLVALFTDKKNLEEIAVLRDQLNILADSLVDFMERYEQMPD